MARTVVVIPVLLGVGIGLGLMSCEAPRNETEASAVTGGLTYGGEDEPGPGSGAWLDAGAPGTPDAGPGSGGWPDSGTPDAEWPDAGMPDAEWPDAGPPMDGPVYDAPTDGPKEDEPPKGEDGKPIPGWKKKIPLETPADGQWWKDTDGVDPAVAGCHYAYKTEAKCMAGEEVVGWLGEECRENNILVETNPEENKCHEHENATGHPDTFDCDEYCKGKDKASGKCVKVEKVCDGKDGAKTLPSARCECE